MKKGLAMEGFIREDGTIRPIEHYDDTELRGKIQTNTDNISNLDSRVAELEEHGGVEDPTKADKVTTATAGDIALLTEEGNLYSNGKKLSDLAPATHSHDIEDVTGLTDALAAKAAKNKIEDENAGHVEVADGEVDIDAPHGIHLHIVDESGESDVQHDVDIDASNVANLEDALASAKIPLWNNGVIPFETSNGSLVLVSDTSEYDSLFTNVPQIGAGKIYYSTRIIVDDTAVFLAICEAETKTGGYLEFEHKKVVTMFVGGYTLVIQKGVTSGTVTLKKVSSLDAVLSASVESTSQAES